MVNFNLSNTLMKKAAFLLSGLLISLYALAQTYAMDSMKRILKSTTYVDSNKVKICMQISNAWLKLNADSALAYANKSYDLASTLNYPLYQADARALQAKICTIIGQYDKAYDYNLEAQHKYIRQNNAEGVGHVYIELAKTFDKQDNYSRALIYLQQALNTFTTANNKPGMALSYLEIGKVHSKVNETEKAIINFQKAVDVSSLSSDRTTTINAFNLLCKEYGNLGNYNKALQAATRAKNLALISGLLPEIGEANFNLGKAYADVNNFDSSMYAYRNALTYFTKLHDKQAIAKAYDGIGELYYMYKDYANATQYIKLSNQYALDLGDKKLLEINYNALLAIAKDEKNYEMGMGYYNEILALKDNLYNTEKNISIQKVRSWYELEKKQAEIATLQQDNLDKTHERNLFIIGFSLVALSLVALGYSIKQLMSKKVILEKQKKELEEVNLVKDKFFSIISHDLRSPMANILGLLQLLSDDHFLSKEEVSTLFERLRFSTSSALETMDNMLVWGMNQIQENTIETKEVDVQEIAQRVCRFLQQSADNKSIQLINHVNEPIKIWADKNHVEFILRNLVSNALKFTHKNGVVELWVSSDTSNKQIHIRDTGTGMSAEQKHKLFDDTKKGSVKGTAGETGSGLGLMLSKQFIRKNNGSLSVKSEQGKGSVFTVSLPQAGAKKYAPKVTY